jgi:hypothetical protein
MERTRNELPVIDNELPVINVVNEIIKILKFNVESLRKSNIFKNNLDYLVDDRVLNDIKSEIEKFIINKHESPIENIDIRATIDYTREEIRIDFTLHPYSSEYMLLFIVDAYTMSLHTKHGFYKVHRLMNALKKDFKNDMNELIKKINTNVRYLGYFLPDILEEIKYNKEKIEDKLWNLFTVYDYLKPGSLFKLNNNGISISMNFKPCSTTNDFIQIISMGTEELELVIKHSEKNGLELIITRRKDNDQFC